MADPFGGRATVSAAEAFTLLGIDRTTGYRAIKDGTFPVAVIRVGRVIRVPAASLRGLLDGHNVGYAEGEVAHGRSA